MNAETTRRIGLIGFDRRTCEAFETAGIEVAAHIYANPDNKNANYPGQDHLINFHNWKQYNFERATPSSKFGHVRETARQQCFQDFIRCTDRWDWSRELVHNWNDYDHLFSLAFNHACNWLETHRPDVVVYSNVPHQGVAIVNFHTARALGIKTRIFIQSPFGGRSWLVDHWNDLGSFASSVPGEPFEIDVSAPTAPPFYMNSVRGNANRRLRSLGHKLRARTIVGLGLTGFTPETRRRNFQRNLGRWQRAVEDERYLSKASRFFKDKPGNEPYVYFPLHLQPEMTTDILGGIFADQALALEKLRLLMPDQIAIYIKENPKQTGRLRSDTFMERLSSLKNVKLLSHEVPSFPLSENAKAVATITGTVGWEAVRMGKPVIVFGNTFWNQLPGAFKYTDDLSWNAIDSFSFDAKSLGKSVNGLSKHAHHGISDRAYAVLQEGFNPEANAADLANTLITKGWPDV
ncbi:MAG: hypothetical protein AAF423_07910 [Pseudomonadota bacterium]